MPGNIVVITAIKSRSRMPHLEYCLHSWKWWCGRMKVDFFLMDRGIDTPCPMRPTWQRYGVFRFLDARSVNFDRMALIDADTMVSWRCPDFFKLSQEGFSAVKDNRRTNWVKSSIHGYRNIFPDTSISPDTYINAGFMILGQAQRAIFEAMLDLYRRNSRELQEITRTLRKGSDQTPLNYLLARDKVPVGILPGEYNLTHLVPRVVHPRPLLAGYPIRGIIRRGYVWHFTGLSLRSKNLIMKRVWMSTKDRYNG